MIPTIVGALLIPFIKGITALLSYISNNAFPQPLSEPEEADCLVRLQEGDEQARNKLIEHNLRLVAHLVKKFDGTGENNDDLISIGTIGLIKAINTYNADKGTKLATYAARCIENEILMHLRAMKKTRGEVSLYDPIGVDKEGNEITLIDILGTDPETVSDVVENAMEQARLLSKLKRLSKRERYVIELRYGLLSGCRQTQREIARNLGISRSYVSRIEKRAVQKLMKDLGTVDGA
ncbi:RNA polymerase sporulation sigma factor SigK [Heliobacillus mobilis]|uniref:RNA polymerase sigma factor n=1 Tax=Heliobacterium mobile TaxID=28064 RepID=A0A6I3SKC6_HELMO|nr:RNA polymerase sporulation sigma factor SigK [Heliobacterium mobile]MTV49398.1 RNA polymerase sporulation sigma factor SigK [Heliobacterium mobile]